MARKVQITLGNLKYFTVRVKTTLEEEIAAELGLKVVTVQMKLSDPVRVAGRFSREEAAVSFARKITTQAQERLKKKSSLPQPM